MANTVSIVVTAQDKSGPAINSAVQGIKNVGTVAAGILSANLLQGAATRMQQFIGSTVKAASSLGESVNAVGKVFGSEAKFVEQWGKDNAAAFGLSQRAFNELVTPMGALLKNTGMDMKDVSSNTIDLTKRAADMASVFNTDVSTALEAIQSGLRGETDPLEQFGVHLSAAAIQSEALAETGKDVASTLTEEEKATARVNLIMKQTASVAGDFAETSDGLANSQRIATAEIENAQAKIGGAFLPILAKAAQAVGTLADLFSKLPGPMQTTVGTLLAIGAAFILLAPKIVAAKEVLSGFGTASEFASTKMGKVSIAAGKIGAAFIALQAAGGILSALFSDKLQPDIQGAARELETWDGKTKLSGASSTAFGDNLSDVGDAFQNLTQNGIVESINGFDQWAASMVGATGPMDDAKNNAAKFDAVLAQLVKTGHEATAAQLLHKAAVEEGNVTVEEAIKALPNYREALKGVADGTIKVDEASISAAKAVDNLEKSMQDSMETAFGLESAQDAVTNAVHDLTDQIKEQKKANDKGAGSFRGNTDAALANRAAARDLISKYADLIGEQAAAGKSTDGLKAKLQNTLEKLGMSASEAREYANALGDIPKNISTNVVTHYTTTGTPIGPRGGARATFAHGGITGAASGGIRSNSVLVGEHGPEVADLPPGTNVHSNPDSMRMMNGSGSGQGVTVNLYVSGSIHSDRDIVKVIRDAFVNGAFRGVSLA